MFSFFENIENEFPVRGAIDTTIEIAVMWSIFHTPHLHFFFIRTR